MHRNQVTPEIGFSRLGENNNQAEQLTGRKEDFNQDSVRKQLFHEDSSSSISAASLKQTNSDMKLKMDFNSLLDAVSVNDKENELETKPGTIEHEINLIGGCKCTATALLVDDAQFNMIPLEFMLTSLGI